MKRLYIEHSEFGAQVVTTDLCSADELVSKAIRMECWGLTYYVQPPAPKPAPPAGPPWAPGNTCDCYRCFQWRAKA